MKNFKRMLSFCLIVLMLAALTVPAMAAAAGGANIEQIGGAFSLNGNNNLGTGGKSGYDITPSKSTNGVISSKADADTQPSAIHVEAGANQTVYITPADGYEVKDVKIDGESVGAVTEYLFENVKKDHRIEATFVKAGEDAPAEEPAEVPAESDLPFVDVAPDDWFYDSVDYTYTRNLFVGMSDTTFEPDTILNRAMIVTVLYRLEGKPAVEFAGMFDDVEDGTWYSEAVEWAAANDIVLGYGDGNYGPLDDLTREQAMAILNRYADFKGYEYEIGEIDTEGVEIDDWALDNVKWAATYEIIYMPDGTLASTVPVDPICRAEMAYALMQFSLAFVD